MSQASPRPARARVLDELGLPKTLPAGRGDFLTLFGHGPDVLLLGLGPEPEALPELLDPLGLAPGASVRFLEAPALAEQLGADWRARIPARFAPAGAAELADLAAQSRVILYRPGPRLFPGFWGPTLARLQLARLPQAPAVDKGLVWLPGGEDSLLRRELAEACALLGLRAQSVADETELRRRLAGGVAPALYFSVNFSGLDPLGEAAHLLAAAGSRVAVWCVDNPLHLVSGLRARFWLDLPLFVTDDWFLGPLQKLGARHAQHLPLAARDADLAQTPRAPSPEHADLAGRLVFAGRSAFPDKDGFFAGQRLPAAAWTEARRMLDTGGRPDFEWWLARLGIDRLWPGTDARRAGFCAEETGRAWRAACLSRAHADLGGMLSVYGDAGWRELLPEGVDLRGPVDYYAALPGIVAGAAASLNCTSPLLPRGLTQRHFDAWAWGGLLLTDATPGLSLFPAELTRDIAFRAPGDMAPRLRALLARPGASLAALKADWRAELAARHTYSRRLGAVLKAAGLA